MNPDVAFPSLVAASARSASRRVLDAVLADGVRAAVGCTTRCATRCSAAASAYARCSPMRAANSRRADPAHVDRGRRRRLNSSTPIRSCTTTCPAWTTTCCAAASRPAMSRSARPSRCLPATRCKAWLSKSLAQAPAPAMRRRQLAAARARVRLARHGRRAGDRPRGGRYDVALPELERHASAEDRRADPRSGAPRARGCGRTLAATRTRRSTATRRRSGWRSRSSTTCSTSKARRKASARPPARTRPSKKPTYVSLLGLAAARQRIETLRAEAHAALARFGAPARAAPRNRRLDRAAQALMLLETINSPADLRRLTPDAVAAARARTARFHRAVGQRRRAAICRRISARSS